MTILMPPGANPGKFPTLGFDPAPGESAVVDATSTKIAKVAGDLDGMREELAKIATVGGIWEGVAAQAFKRVLDPLPKQADEIAQALYKASGLLTDWEGSLGDYQRRALDLERQAAAAQKELDQARSDPALDLAGKHFPDDESLREAQARYDAAVQDVRMWEDRLQEIIDQAKRLLETHQGEAGRIADQLNKIIEDTRGMLDKLGDAVGGAIDAIGDAVTDFAGDVWNWVQDNADFIKNIGDAFSAMSTALGTLAVGLAVIGPFTGPGAVVLEPLAMGLGAASAVTSGVALGAHGLAKAAGADVGWDTLAIDALGVAAPGVGKVAGKTAGLMYDSFVAGAGWGSGGGQVIEDLGTYWLPDSAGEAGLMAVSPGGLAVWNAWEEAQGNN